MQDAKSILGRSWDDPYQCHLITRVSSVNGNRILFDETIAFSFSGGQESDKAYINSMNVLDSEMEGSLIYYILPEGHGLSVGDKVTMEIDWPRRYCLMRLHFAAELILELTNGVNKRCHNKRCQISIINQESNNFQRHAKSPVLSVGYRINSKKATHFRQWVTKTLKEHIQRGYTINRHRIKSNYEDFLKAVSDVKSIATGSVVDSDSVLELVNLRVEYVSNLRCRLMFLLIKKSSKNSL